MKLRHLLWLATAVCALAGCGRSSPPTRLDQIKELLAEKRHDDVPKYLSDAWLAECTLFGMLLVLVAHVHASTLSLENFRLTSEIVQATDARVVCGRVVRYFGAGIYEELLFRLILVPIAMAVVGLAIAPRRPKIIVVLVVTSALFSLAHYVGPHGEDFAVYTFVFRFIAGGIFALLFIFRGFGIAVGTHALYDIFVGL